MKFFTLVLCPEAVFASSGTTPQLPSSASPLFANYPEWYVEDVTEFLLFALEHLPLMVSRTFDNIFITWLLTMICSANFFNNPYLLDNLVDVLYKMSVFVPVRILF